MSNIQVKNSPASTKKAKRSRYEKMEVAFGRILVNTDTPDIVFGDTAVFSKAPIKELINARFVGNDGDVLELFRGVNDVNTPVTWANLGQNTTAIDYVVSYIKGTGHAGAGYSNSGPAGYQLAVTILPNAAGISAKSATPGGAPGTTCAMSATVQPQGAATTVFFDYGTTTAYGHTLQATSNGSIADGTTGSVTSTGTITGLTASTVYHYRVRAVNAAGTTSSADGTFTTHAAT